MKKKDKPPISIILPKEKYTLGAPCSFYAFFTLFSFSLGIYSSLLLMISSAAPNYKTVLILGLFSFFLTILQKYSDSTETYFADLFFPFRQTKLPYL